MRAKYWFVLVLSYSLSLGVAAEAFQVFIAGDSTASIKDPKDYPETGWGEPFATFFSDQVMVRNYAKNGRSTRTFIEEGLWAKVTEGAKPGDVVFIQFGHNDQSEHKLDRYVTPEQYQVNIKRMVADIKALGAEPILMTSVIRRYFDDSGKIKHVHPYAQYVREFAKAEGVFMIDMEAMTRAYFEPMGDELSALRFMHIGPNLHPNYPNGLRDDTHFNELGAREVAQLLLAELKARKHKLASHLRSVDPKHMKLSY
jgi:lysophospholipase L1-like esterase